MLLEGVDTMGWKFDHKDYNELGLHDPRELVGARRVLPVLPTQGSPADLEVLLHLAAPDVGR
jgi:hypothetical protein